MNSGPIMQDRFWFFYATRYSGSGNDLPGIFYNKNAGDITKWTYDPDFTRPANNSSSGSITPTLRLTAQLNRSMQVGVFVDAGGFRLSDYPQIGVVGAVPLATPETGTVGGSGRSPMFQYKWTWTATSRLLLDASYGSYHQDWNGRERPGNNRDLIRMTEQCTAGCANNGGGVPGLVYRAQVWNADYMEPNRWQAAATYVTGAHNMKSRLSRRVPLGTRLTPTATTRTSNTGSTTACRTSSRSSRGRTSQTRACDTTPCTHRTSGLAESSPSREPSATTTPGATIPRSRSGRLNSSRRRSSFRSPKA